MMKKLIIALLALAYLSACGQANNSDDSPVENTADQNLNPNDKSDSPADKNEKKEENHQSEVPGAFSKLAMLENIATGVIMPKIKDFQRLSESFRDRSISYCAKPTGSELDELRSDWERLLFLWGELAVTNIGPSAFNNNEIFESILSSSFRAYPFFVYTEAQKVKDSSNLSLPFNPNRRGLDAIESILFKADDFTQNRCPRETRLPDSWLGLTAQEKTAFECNYLVALTTELSENATDLKTGWSASGGNFIEAFSKASAWDSPHTAANALFQSLTYIESVVKDIYLAVPLGVNRKFCPNAPCTCQTPQLISGKSLLLIQGSLQGFKDVFYGDIKAIKESSGTALGFDDFLNHVESHDVRIKIESSIDDLERWLVKPELRPFNQKVDELPQGTGCDAFEGTANPPLACSLYLHLKSLTDLIKTEMSQVLGLKLPESVSGDND